MSGPEEPEMEKQDSPNGTNNETNWLDDLGKEPTKIYSEDDSSQENNTEPHGTEQVGDEFPGWMAEDLEQDVPVDEAVPDWLKDEMAAGEEKDSDDLDDDRELDIENTAVFSQPINLSDEDIPEWLSDEVEDDQASQAAAEDADELSWLDQIAAGEGAAIEEPLTLSWEENDQEVTDELSDSADEDMTWLDDMSTLPAVTAEELAARSGEGLPPSQDESPMDETVLGFQDSGDPMEDSPDSVPEDPDEAMAWLERLAARQGAPAEELPSFTDESHPMSVVDAGEMPEDPDEAMAWLEKMAEEQGEQDAEMIPVIQEVQPEPGHEGFERGDERIEEAVAEEVEKPPADEEIEYALSGLDSGEMPGDMDEALSWLEDLIVEEKSLPLEEESPVLAGDISEEGVGEITVETGIIDDGITAEVEIPAEITMEGMVDGQLEEDSDAMAWLEKLAARQGASPEELTIIDSELEEPVAPDWLRQEMDEALKEAVDTEPEVAEGVAAEAVELESEMEIDMVEVPAVEDEPLEKESDLAGIFDEEVVGEELDTAESVFEFEDIPGIKGLSESPLSTGALDPSVVDEATQDDLAWMDTLGSVDADSWLEAEAGATNPNLTIPEISPDSDQIIELAERDSMELGEKTFEEPQIDTGDLIGDVDGVLNPQHLQAARGAIAAGNLDSALSEFGALLQQGEGLPYIIAELHTSISNYGEQPRLQRLLGDAYVQNGQLKKAIEVYRQALDNL